MNQSMKIAFTISQFLPYLTGTGAKLTSRSGTVYLDFEQWGNPFKVRISDHFINNADYFINLNESEEAIIDECYNIIHEQHLL